MNQEGNNATAVRLTDALRSKGLKNLADILVCPSDPSKVSIRQIYFHEEPNRPQLKRRIFFKQQFLVVPHEFLNLTFVFERNERATA